MGMLGELVRLSVEAKRGAKSFEDYKIKLINLKVKQEVRKLSG